MVQRSRRKYLHVVWDLDLSYLIFMVEKVVFHIQFVLKSYFPDYHVTYLRSSNKEVLLLIGGDWSNGLGVYLVGIEDLISVFQDELKSAIPEPTYSQNLPQVEKLDRVLFSNHRLIKLIENFVLLFHKGDLNILVNSTLERNDLLAVSRCRSVKPSIVHDLAVSL